jgi:hypothetical protein
MADCPRIATWILFLILVPYWRKFWGAESRAPFALQIWLRLAQVAASFAHGSIPFSHSRRRVQGVSHPGQLSYCPECLVSLRRFWPLPLLIDGFPGDYFITQSCFLSQMHLNRNDSSRTVSCTSRDLIPRMSALVLVDGKVSCRAPWDGCYWSLVN